MLEDLAPWITPAVTVGLFAWLLVEDRWRSDIRRTEERLRSEMRATEDRLRSEMRNIRSEMRAIEGRLRSR